MWPFSRKKITAKEFRDCCFAFLETRITVRQGAEEALKAVKNLATLNASESQRERLAAHWYLALESYISQAQPKNRVTKETLREEVRRHCRPEHAEGNFPLLFLNETLRQIRLGTIFTATTLERVQHMLDREKYQEMLRPFAEDKNFKGVVKNGGLHGEVLEHLIRDLPPSEQLIVARSFFKNLLIEIVKRVNDSVGEIRTELFFQEIYREFRDTMRFLDDAPEILHIVPDTLLNDERVDLLQKTELAEELKRKSEALEATIEKLESEKIKTPSVTSSLSREDLEKKVTERTGDLVRALEDLKSSRDSLEEAKAKDEAFLESIDEGLVAIDREWNIILWNKAASLITGWSRRETIGKPLRNFVRFIRERDRGENITFIEESMLMGKTTQMQEHTALVRKFGDEVEVSSRASPIFEKSGKVISAIIIFSDISKERELERTREEFGSLTTHQLRSPLAAIKGYAQLLLEEKTGTLTDNQRDFVTNMLHATERLIALVNAMLNVSRIELGTIAINPEATYLPDIADDVIQELAPRIEEKKLTLEKDYTKNLPSVSVDKGLMHAIIQNLLSNAVKYTPKKGSIGIRMEKQKDDFLVSVSDTGYGIPEADKAKIFTKLFRAANIAAQEPEGTGLGLYIVKSILDQAGGKIWFESVEKKGTTFFITIPLEGMKKKEGMKGLV